MGYDTCTSFSVYNKSTSKHNLKGVWDSSMLANRNEVLYYTYLLMYNFAKINKIPANVYSIGTQILN